MKSVALGISTARQLTSSYRQQISWGRTNGMGQCLPRIFSCIRSSETSKSFRCIIVYSIYRKKSRKSSRKLMKSSTKPNKPSLIRSKPKIWSWSWGYNHKPSFSTNNTLSSLYNKAIFTIKRARHWHIIMTNLQKLKKFVTNQRGLFERDSGNLRLI